ncbi:hypothetical protein C8J57DRAFT_1046838 [Mycena rebaudengoi]|nr:hypothetical protein C8J57DRAFT_1046838 [Mycena rebaudengoi]
MLQSSSASLEERKYLGNASVELLGVPMESLFMFNMVVGDTVVIWRAWVLYPKKQLWAIIIPCFILLMSFIFAVIQVTCLTGAGWGDHSASALGGPVCEQAGLIAWAFSFVTNATCTILISIKAWQHRRMMRSTLGHRTATEKVLTLLVESGFVYCLFWLTQLTIFFDIPRTSPLIYVYFLCAGMGDQISGMYPTLIIVIVNLHRSALEVASSSSRSGSVLPHGASSAKSLPTAASFNSQRGHKIHLDSETELGSMGAKGTSSYAPPGEP